jgi:hypothetical protein
MKFTPIVCSCAAMLVPPICCSFLYRIDSLWDPLLLLATAFAWPITSLVVNAQMAGRVFGGLVLLGCAVWLSLFMLPFFTLRLRRIWYYVFQLT